MIVTLQMSTMKAERLVRWLHYTGIGQVSAQRKCSKILHSCIQSVTTLIRIRYSLYFRQITWFDGEKKNPDWVASAWKSIHSICSTVITTNLEEKCFQAFKCVRMKNSSTDAHSSLSVPPGEDFTTLPNIWWRCVLVLKSLDSASHPQ